MTAQAQWTQIEAALDEILALPESEWPEACARLSRNDDGLLAEINALLACTRGVDPVLDRPLTVPDREIWGVTGRAAGTRVGAYRIIELIGRGGMGEGYRAERADAPYKHAGALK